MGYIVGEDWEGTDDINVHSYSGDGLRSAFDFPARYNMVQGAAQEESGAGGYGIETFSNVHRTPSEKGYPNNVYPNLFFTNHDIWRLGNLIRNKYGENKDADRYWNRHKMCIGALSVYTGPITLYYGDEIGDITDCWTGKAPSCGPNTDKDNCARTDGQITNFDNKQQNLHDFTKKLMEARLQHPSMYRGTYGKTFQGNTYFNCKYDPTTGDKTVYVTTLNWDPTTVSYTVGGSKLVDLVSGEVISGNGGVYTISLEGLGTRVFQVIEDSKSIKKANKVLTTNSSQSSKKKKTYSAFIVVGCLCVALAASIAIAAIIYAKITKKHGDSSYDDQDLLLINLNKGYTNPTQNQ